jgi:molybdopterin-containing oxidoreductase family iron-sulfur binding subunit
MNRFPEARGRFWRSIEEAQNGQPPEREVQQASQQAFEPPSMDRRRFLQLAAAAAALAGCGREPLEPIVPYVNGPSETTYGQPVFFASTLARRGYGVGVLVETAMGRPTKIEGNPRHPASLGATDVFEQAAVRDLWDPQRSQIALRDDQPATWDAFLSELTPRLARHRAARGAGLALLVEPHSSPTLVRQLDELRSRLPKAAVYLHAALARDTVRAGAVRAFGRPLELVHRFERARAIVALDADFLGELPGHLRYARDFIATRTMTDATPPRSRLWAAETTPRLAGAMADERLTAAPDEVARVAYALALAVKAPLAERATALELSPPQRAWVEGAARDCLANRGASIVIAGDEQPIVVHALAHAINAALGNFGRTIVAISPVTLTDAPGIDELVRAALGGDIETLAILGANPVYDAPGDLDITRALHSIAFSVHHGLYADETAALCRWHLPAAHALESWSDARAFDGTASLTQPVIAPLYGSRSIHEVLDALAGSVAPNGHALVQATWRDAAGGALDPWWRDALRAGTIADSAFATLDAPLKAPIDAADVPQADHGQHLSAIFRADRHLDDGRYAPNAWLQELPRPFSALTWDNAVLIAPAAAGRMQLRTGDVIEVSRKGARIEGPVWIMPGQADAVLTLPLGFGRSRAGEVGTNVGFDAYRLRPTAALWSTPVEVRATGRHIALASVQVHHRMQGRKIVELLSAGEAKQRFEQAETSKSAPKNAPTLYPPYRGSEYQWAMSIDLGACIGCKACTIACQAENNIPTVGRSEVLRGREMHWIRVDTYFEGRPEAARMLFQPVPCMHCEHAPCEYVCPVEASVHNTEGLNLQVYNRCVGTRFCSNNCPYKVRRFNFLQYSQDVPVLNAQRNPQVTVRMRGVMEKCNYCLQRIRNGRIGAEREGRPLEDGEVLTACQAVCPTQAIVFGNLQDDDSAVRRAKASPLDYALLEELNTRPRTTYLARVFNPPEPKG